MKPILSTLFLSIILAGSIHADTRGPKFKDPVVKFTAIATKAFDIDLRTKLVDPSEPGLQWSVSNNTPSWLHLDSPGNRLWGNPSLNDEGVKTFTITVLAASGEQGDFNHPAEITVIGPPNWIEDPLNLGTQKEGTFYSRDLNASVQNPWGGSLTFTASPNKPLWMNLAGTGNLSGTPQRPDVGKYSGFTFTVTSDLSGLSATVPIKGEVIKHLKPPEWTQNPITLSDAFEDSAYERDLVSYVRNPEQGPLVFNLIGPSPQWLHLSTAGKLSGTPKSNDVGSVALTVRVTSTVDGQLLDGGNADIRFRVIHVNHSPYWTSHPVQFTVPGEKPMQQSIAPHAKDPDPQDVLTFEKLSGPAWASLTPQGLFTGTPTSSDEGPNTFRVRVSDGNGGSADEDVIITVSHVNHPPFWTQNPIQLPNVKEKTLMSENLSPFAKDPDVGDKLTFTKVTGPSWAAVASADGKISGTPKRTDVGINTFTVKVTDQGGLSATTTVNVTVEYVNTPPYWTANPLILPKGTPGKTYSYRVDPYAKDDDGDTLTFSKVSGPSWAFVTTSGLLIGTPTTNDGGVNRITVRVTDTASAFSDTVAEITVEVPQNKPPRWLKDPIPLGNAPIDQPFQFNLSTLAVDDDGDALTFRKVNGPGWLNVSSNGLVTGTPRQVDLGEFTAIFEVSDGKAKAEAGAFGKVVEQSNNHAPVIQSAALFFVVKENDTLRENLNQPKFVSDPDGDPLTFQLANIPSWITLSITGELVLKPLHQHLGTHAFVLRVTDNKGAFAESNLTVRVIPQDDIPVTDKFQVDQAVPGAAVENLWVIDNSWCSRKMIAELKRQIHLYEEDLARAQIQHRGVYLSSAPDKYSGKPIRSKTGETLLLSSNPSWTDDFLSRMKASPSRGERCFGSENSPIWSMFLFYTLLPTFTDIYPHYYFLPNIPMEVLTASVQRDEYRYYSKNAPQAGYTPTDYARDFMIVHALGNKPYRISSIGPIDCRDAEDSDCREDSGDAYREIDRATGGVYYPFKYDTDLSRAIHDYAARVIFRAYVFAKHRVRLSKTPSDPENIQVSIGGVSVATDKWDYDPATNEVVIYWALIDVSQLKPGDFIEIRYRT